MTVRYCKKSEKMDIEAFLWSGAGLVLVPEWFREALRHGQISINRDANPPYLLIDTAVGEMRADMGDYIVKRGAEIYPCCPQDFAHYYEAATDTLTAERNAVEETYAELVSHGKHTAELLCEFRRALANFDYEESFLLTRDYLRYYLSLTLEDEVGTDEPG